MRPIKVLIAFISALSAPADALPVLGTPAIQANLNQAQLSRVSSGVESSDYSQSTKLSSTSLMIIAQSKVIVDVISTELESKYTEATAVRATITAPESPASASQGQYKSSRLYTTLSKNTLSGTTRKIGTTTTSATINTLANKTSGTHTHFATTTASGTASTTLPEAIPYSGPTEFLVITGCMVIACIAAAVALE